MAKGYIPVRVTLVTTTQETELGEIRRYSRPGVAPWAVTARKRPFLSVWLDVSSSP